jgi:RNA polymerase sigma factor (sigma-70 family)
VGSSGAPRDSFPSAGEDPSRSDERWTTVLRLFEAHAPSLRRRCRALVGDDAAEDVLQETLLRAHLHLERLDPARPTGPWLHAIAHRLCLDQLERDRRARDAAHRLRFPPAAWDGDPTFELARARAAWARVRTALGALPVRERAALVDQALRGRPYRDVARAERGTAEAVRGLLRRARVRLRRLCRDLPALAPSWLLRRDRSLRAATVGGSPGVALPAALGALALGLAAVAPTPPQMADGGRRGVTAVAVASSGATGPASPAPRIASLPAPERRHGARRSRSPTTILRRPGAAPEQTRFTSVVASPGYEEDGTLLAAGLRTDGPCRHLRCPILFESRDRGATWRPLRARGFLGGELLLPPGWRPGQPMFAMGPAGLQQSPDGGESFRPASPVAGPAAVSPLLDGGDRRLLIAAGSLFEYLAATGVTLPARVPPRGVVRSVAFAPSYPRTGAILVAHLEPGGRAAVRLCRGRACQRLDLPGAETPPAFVASGAQDLSALYAFTSRAVYEWREGTLGLRRIPLPSAGSGIEGLAAGPTLARISAGPFASQPGQRVVPTLVAALRGPQRGVLVSTDGGRSWLARRVLIPGFRRGVTRVLVVPDGRIIVAGIEKGIACSLDLGRTWGTRCAASSPSAPLRSLPDAGPVPAPPLRARSARRLRRAANRRPSPGPSPPGPVGSAPPRGASAGSRGAGRRPPPPWRRRSSASGSSR